MYVNKKNNIDELPDNMKVFNDDLQMRSDWQVPICLGAERLKDETGKKVNTKKVYPKYVRRVK